MATFLLGFDCQGSPPNSYAFLGPRMGTRTNVYGGLHNLPGIAGDALLLGTVRGWMPSPFLGYHKSVV